MSEEGDSWFKAAFGVDLGQAANKLTEVAGAVIAEAKGIEAQVGGAVQGAFNQVTGAAAGLVQKAAGGAPAAPRAASGGAAGGGTGSFPLGGSVGSGGKNAANDVRAVQAALGIAADGQCGQQTIAAIAAFQRSIGQARPDGRVDAGGATERALAGGPRPAAASGAPAATPGSDDSAGGLAARIGSDAGALLQGAESAVQSTLQSAQDSVFTELGVAPETAEDIKAAEQAIADFDRGRQAGRASGSIGLLKSLPPVQLFEAGVRIADADDGAAEALKIADEKRATLAAIGKFGVDPAGSGAAIGEGLARDASKARDEGRLAEFAGNLVGEGDVVAATVAVGGAGAGVEVGGARGAAAGAEAGGARGVAAGGARGVGAAEGAVPRTLRGLGEPPTLRDPSTLRGLGEPPTLRDPSTLRGLGEPPTLRDPSTLRGLGEPPPTLPDPPTLPGLGEPPPTLRDPSTLRGLGEPPTVRDPATLRGLGEPEAARNPFGEGPPPEVDPANPLPEPGSPEPNVAPTRAQIRQNLNDAIAKQKLAEKASSEANTKFIRFRGDPAVKADLELQARLASNANGEAILELEAARNAEKAAIDAASRAKGARGGGLPPPRR